MKVGDLLYINQNETAIADVVLLTYSSVNNFCYIETASLDGEKALKPKISLLEKDLSGIFLE